MSLILDFPNNRCLTNPNTNVIYDEPFIIQSAAIVLDMFLWSHREFSKLHINTLKTIILIMRMCDGRFVPVANKDSPHWSQVKLYRVQKHTVSDEEEENRMNLSNSEQ